MRPAILPPTIITRMIFVIMKVLNYLQVTEDVGIGLLIRANLTLAITEFIIVVPMVEVDLGIKRQATLFITIVVFIILVLMVKVELGIKRPSTVPFFNCVTRVYVDGRGGYRSQTIQYLSHSPGDRGILFSSTVSSFPVDKNVCGDDRVVYSGRVTERGDISCNDGDGRRIRIRDDIDKRGDISVDGGRFFL